MFGVKKGHVGQEGSLPLVNMVKSRTVGGSSIGCLTCCLQ
jgi:hypothetical protein